MHTPLGYDPHNVLSLNVAFPKGANPTWEGRLNAQEAVRKAIAEVPGVEDASISTTWFPGFGGFNAKVEVQSKPQLADAQAVLCAVSSARIFHAAHSLAGRKNFRRQRTHACGSRGRWSTKPS